jgi:hypothetical protein
MKLFIDPDIDIPPNMPKPLLEDLERLQKYYDADDWSNFELVFDSVDSRIKSYNLTGRISRKDAVQLFHRYGIMI